MDYGIIFALLSPFFSSIATLFQSNATKFLHPIVVSSIGALSGSLILFIIIFVSKERKNFSKIKNNIRDISLMTVLRPLLGATVFAYGLSMTDGIKAIFFTKTEPYFVLFWYWLLKKEQVSAKQLSLLIIHIIGAIILSTGGILSFGKAQLGDLLVIFAMGLFSISYIYGSQISKRLGSRLSNAITLGLGGLLLLPFVFVVTSPIQLFNQRIGWAYLFTYVILFNVIGLTLWFASLRTVKGWIVSSLRSLGPLIGAPFAYFVFGQTLSMMQIVGGIIVLITSALITREHFNSSK